MFESVKHAERSCHKVHRSNVDAGGAAHDAQVFFAKPGSLEKMWGATCSNVIPPKLSPSPPLRYVHPMIDHVLTQTQYYNTKILSRLGDGASVKTLLNPPILHLSRYLRVIS